MALRWMKHVFGIRGKDKAKAIKDALECDDVDTMKMVIEAMETEGLLTHGTHGHPITACILHRASKANALSCLEYLIPKFPKQLNLQNSPFRGGSPFSIAIKDGNGACAQIILETAYKHQIQMRVFTPRSALHTMLDEIHWSFWPQLIDLMGKCVPEVWTENWHGNGPLRVLALEVGKRNTENDKRNLKKAQDMFKRKMEEDKSDSEDQTFSPGENAEDTVRRNEVVLTCIMLLMQNGARISAVNRHKETALHLLCGRMQSVGFSKHAYSYVTKALKCVLEKGATGAINVRQGKCSHANSEGSTPLIVMMNSIGSLPRESVEHVVEMVFPALKLLLDHGADPNLQDVHGLFPVSVLFHSLYKWVSTARVIVRQDNAFISGILYSTLLISELLTAHMQPNMLASVIMEVVKSLKKIATIVEKLDHPPTEISYIRLLSSLLQPGVNPNKLPYEIKTSGHCFMFGSLDCKFYILNALNRRKTLPLQILILLQHILNQANWNEILSPDIAMAFDAEHYAVIKKGDLMLTNFRQPRSLKILSRLEIWEGVCHSYIDGRPAPDIGSLPIPHPLQEYVRRPYPSNLHPNCINVEENVLTAELQGIL